MKKIQNRLAAIAICISGCTTLSAQTDDSLYLDLGRVRIKKDFTQSVTISGKDLEHMPFATLTNAINGWFQGYLNMESNTIYVVDGNLVNDVNAWSIYDIEEITWVQNAIVQVNGAMGNQQLVLIKTRQGDRQEKGGVLLAGSSYLVNTKLTGVLKDEDPKTLFYHQYHVSAWKNNRNVRYGLSGNFLRDAYPAVNIAGYDIHKPDQIMRYRLNGWVNVALHKNHQIGIRLNYVPQTRRYDVTASTMNGIPVLTNWSKVNQSLIHSSLTVSNRFTKNFTHQLDFSFLSAREKATGLNERTITQPTLPDHIIQTQFGGKSTDDMFLVRDRISYVADIGNWRIEPSVNATFRHVKQKDSTGSTTTTSGQMPSWAYISTNAKGKFFVLSPQAAISYKNIFYLYAGAALNASENTRYDDNRFHPFGSLTVDALRLFLPEHAYSLQVFASYARIGDFADIFYVQQRPNGVINSGQISLPSGPAIISFPEDPTYRTFQVGSRFGLPDNRLTISYHYENRKYHEQLLLNMPVPGQGTTYVWPRISYQAHRLGVTGRILKSSAMEWTAGLHVNTYKSEYDLPLSGTIFDIESNGGKALWTGGWTNRLQVKNFLMGLDLLYLLNEHRYAGINGTIVNVEKENCFKLNNLFVGYRFNLAGKVPFELYASTTLPWSNDAVTPGAYSDRLRYYGLGFRIPL